MTLLKDADEVSHISHKGFRILEQDGTANYFKGLMLVLCYLIVAASFFVHMDPQDPHRECTIPLLLIPWYFTFTPTNINAHEEFHT